MTDKIQTSSVLPTTEELQISRDLLDFISSSPSPYHVTAALAGMLEKAGFTPLKEAAVWHLDPGGCYYVTRNNSSLIAFCIPEDKPLRFQITAAHSDSPSFRIKTNPYVPCAGPYICLNVEKYGGAVLSSWLDRPLSIAGRVMVRESGSSICIRQHLVNFDHDLLLIPNIAIHMNRKINEGYAYQIQKDMLPLFGSSGAEGKLEELIARELDCSPADILCSDLFLYNRTAGTIWGGMNEYVSSPKLDDLQCAYSAVRALIQAARVDGSCPDPAEASSPAGFSRTDDSCPDPAEASFPVLSTAPNSICAAAVFDSEEVGSRTAQGADSTFLEDTLYRIWMSLSQDHSFLQDPSVSYRIALAGSFLISADNAHALHPHHADKADPIHRPLMNGGPVIKFSANQKYASDAFSASVFQALCDHAGVPWQVFHNHSDQTGGSTLGNLSNAHVSLHTVDIGLAQLSMHSSYETAGARDASMLIRVLETFNRTPVRIEEDHFLF